jgi:two-component system cell cycle sensor histidine kinase/response regulator CckA
MDRATDDAASDWALTVRDLDVGVVVHDAALRVLYTNPKAEALLGLTSEEFAARSATDAQWDVILPDGRVPEPHEHPVPRAIATGSAVRGVVLGVRHGSSAHRAWILASAVPQRDASGAVARVVVSFTDVSEAQQALRESLAAYQSVFRSMSEGLVIHNADGTIRTANAAAESVLGLTLAQMTGRAATDPRWRLLSATGAPVASDGIPSELALRTGAPAGPTVLAVERANGERAWLEVRADPLREPGDPTVRGAVATFTDITSERATRLALESSRTQIQRVLDAVPGVVFQSLHRDDGTSGLSFVGGRLRELLGVADEAAARAEPDRLLGMVPAAERAALEGAIARAMSTHGLVAHEFDVARAEGGVRWMRLFGVSERTADGAVCTGVLLDVTAEKQMADALRSKQRREAMGDMAAGIAHNFNNMLAVILPNLQLARSAPPDEAASLLGDAERAARSAADLVDRMLALGRADGGVGSDRVDLVPLVRDALHMCRATFDRGIAITDALDVRRAIVRGTASELQQVVLNLCLNARDALAGRPGPALHVALAGDGRSRVTLTVRDTGAGMTDEVLRRLGEPFFTTKEPGRGTGLGLASAFATIAEAGGFWSVAPTPGGGTTFVVELPLVGAAAAPTPPPGARTTPPLSGTALVVDDEPMVRTALGRQLSRLGLQVELADGAAAALAALERGLPSLSVIVLDLSMPGMSGAEALPLLKRLAPEVPVVALSGHVPDGVDLRLASAVVGKPVGQAELEQVLRSVAVGENGPAARRNVSP